jgi:predicted NBD/HSP70 family sugar kinase
VHSFDDLLRLVEADDARALAALGQMAGYLGAFLANLATGLAPEVIVVVGEVTRVWNRVGPLIERAVHARMLPGSTTRIVPTDPAMQPRLRGAVTLVVQQHFGAPNVA